MKTKEEIEQLANEYSNIGKEAGLTHKEYTLENIAYKKGYAQCQEDIAKELYEFGVEGMYSKEEVYELMIKAFNAGFNKYESVEAGLEGKEADLECANILAKYVKTKLK